MKLVYRGKEYDTSERAESKGSITRTYRGVKYSRSQGKGWQMTPHQEVYRGIKFNVDSTGRKLVAA